MNADFLTNMPSYTYRVVPPKGADIGFLARWVVHLGERMRNHPFPPHQQFPATVGKLYGRELSPEEWGGTSVRWQITLHLNNVTDSFIESRWLPAYLQRSVANFEGWEITKGQKALQEEFPKFDWQWRETVLLGLGGTFPLEFEWTGSPRKWKASVSAPHIGEGVRFSTSRHDKAPDAMRELLLLVGQLQQLITQLDFLKV